jgi:hypothetical protein
LNVVTPLPLKRLTNSVVIYIILALLGAMMAIGQNLPAQFAGSSSELSVTQSFVYGIGTALSPPLSTLVIQVILLMLTRRNDGWGTFGVLGLTLTGAFTCIGALGEPINKRIFNPSTFDGSKAALMAGLIVLPLVIVAFGLMEWSRRQRET